MVRQPRGDGIAQRLKKVEIKKGRMLHLNGDLTERHYTDREGKDRNVSVLRIAHEDLPRA